MPCIGPDARRVSKARLLSQTFANTEVADSHIRCRTTGPNAGAGLCIPTYVLGIGQTNMSGSIRSIDNLYGNLPLHRDHNKCRLISKYHKIHFWCS